MKAIEAEIGKQLVLDSWFETTDEKSCFLIHRFEPLNWKDCFLVRINVEKSCFLILWFETTSQNRSFLVHFSDPWLHSLILIDDCTGLELTSVRTVTIKQACGWVHAMLANSSSFHFLNHLTLGDRPKLICKLLLARVEDFTRRNAQNEQKTLSKINIIISAHR